MSRLAVTPAAALRIEVAAIMRMCARSGGISMRELAGRQRQRQYVRPRQLAAWLACELREDLSTAQIGRAFGLDHTTIIHARDKVACEIGRTGAEVWTDLQLGAKVDDVWPLRLRGSRPAVRGKTINGQHAWG